MSLFVRDIELSANVSAPSPSTKVQIAGSRLFRKFIFLCLYMTLVKVGNNHDKRELIM